MAPISTSFKFLSTVSLGLATGVSLAPNFLFIPALYAFPSASTAHQAYFSLRSTTERASALLSSTAVLASLASFLFSRRGAKHPYLIWAAGVAALSFGGSGLLIASSAAGPDSKFSGEKGSKGKGKATVTAKINESLIVVDNEEEEDVNGEEISREMEAWGAGMILRAAGTGLAWFIMIVGVWGDGA